MQYQCGHEACDLCGRRLCEPTGSPELKDYGHYKVCRFCTRKAIEFTVKTAQTFGGTVIDITKPCGRLAVEIPTKGWGLH